MEELAVARPLFHSEADFQHALAWQLHCTYPKLQVRLEVPLAFGTIDLLLAHEGDRLGVELKYGRGPLNCLIAGETYSLPEHPLPVVRYEFWQDVQRLEGGIRLGAFNRGVALCLSNHDLAWKVPTRRTTQDAIHFYEGRRATKVMALDERPRSGREFAPILLGREYDCRWSPYSAVSDCRFGVAKYLAILVNDAGEITFGS